MKKILIISLILYIVYKLYINKNNERFSLKEMKDYSSTLKINCKKNKKLYNSLSKQNKERCNKKGRTQRETINHKSRCRDNIAKEIISKFDMESNCTISDIINKNLNNTKEILNKQNKTKQNTNNSIIEGPEFINQWMTSTNDSKKVGNYSDITLNKPLMSTTNYSIL
jgi:hypothetical protein